MEANTNDLAGRYEVVVVGGGAAGLSAAVVLARARRSVLVVDAGSPRNAPAEGVHSYLTRNGMAPGEFVEAGRAEVRGFGGRVHEDAVASLERLRDGFRVRLAGGASVEADRLLVATGLVDQLPQVPGLAERWGRDILHCPYCHGWEVRDQPVAILATSSLAVHGALLWRQWTDQVTVLRHTAEPFSEADAERLEARGIPVVEGKVTGLEVSGDALAGVVVEGERSVPCEALVVAPTFTAAARLLTDLGLKTVELTRDGHVLGSYVDADANGATSVPGVWVAGNVSNPMAQVVSAADAGVRAAGAINADLIEAETRRAVAERRQALTL